MTNDVPDTGLVKAFLPIKPGAFTPVDAKPSCSNCPCGTRDAHGGGGKLVCTRFPPELVMQVKVNSLGLPTQVPNVGFKPVQDDMVCWEHPVMQVRMEQAILAAHDRDRKLRHLRAGVINSDVNPMDEAALEAERKRVRAEPASVQEADGRNPGDET